MNKKIKILISVIVLVIVFLFTLNYFLQKEEKIIVDEIPNFVENVDIIAINNLIIPDQAGGSEIFLEKILLKTEGNGGYVLIHEAIEVDNEKKEDGLSNVIMYEKGEVLGVSNYFAPGVVKNKIMGLNNSVIVEAGDVLFAVLHEDDGNGVYLEEEDLEAKHKDGSILIIQFNIVAEEDLPGFEFKL